MKKLNLLLGFIISITLINCSTKEEQDREKEVVFTIYEETGFGGAILSTYLTEPLLFSESDNEKIRNLTNILVEGLVDFNYERGYRYTFKAKKIWMSEPPQDASDIKYILSELLLKEKVITEDKEEEMTLFVASETIKFIPRYRKEYEAEDESAPNIYDALRVKEVGKDSWMALVDIEDFNYKSGWEYEIRVRKVTQAEPYSVKYVLLDIVSKKEKI
ncbi:DUF4377 domain-containing protein [Labilibaculum euxinus]